MPLLRTWWMPSLLPGFSPSDVSPLPYHHFPLLPHSYLLLSSTFANFLRVPRLSSYLPLADEITYRLFATEIKSIYAKSCLFHKIRIRAPSLHIFHSVNSTCKTFIPTQSSILTRLMYIYRILKIKLNLLTLKIDILHYKYCSK